MPESMPPQDRPFTLHGAGCSRAVLRRLQLAGEVRRVLRGVYAHADLELTPEVRHAALDLVMSEGATAVGACAAWAHGLLERCPPLRTAHRPPLDIVEAVISVGPDEGLVVYDAALRRGVAHLDLLRAVPGAQRSTVALADGRARDAGESRLRQAWLTADLPTPTLGHLLPGVGARVSLAHPLRCFAATTDRLSDRDGTTCRHGGWWVTQIDAERALDSPLDLLAGHLRREFHRQLLTQIDLSPVG